MGKMDKAQVQLKGNTQNASQVTTLEYDQLRKAVLVLRAINHPIRRSIMEMLENQERMNVTDMYVKLRLEQSVASQHLAILRRAGVVVTERQGKFIHYYLSEKRLEQINTLIHSLAHQ